MTDINQINCTNLFGEDKISSKRLETLQSGRWQFFPTPEILAEKKQIREQTIEFLKNAIRDRYSEYCLNEQEVHDALKQAFFNAGVSMSNTRLTGNAARKVFDQIDSVITGFNNESLLPGLQNHQATGPDDLRAAFAYLLTDQGLSSELISWDNFKAIFFNPNPKMMQRARGEIQDILHELFQQTNGISHERSKMLETLIGNVLSFYAYMDPQSGETLTIPQKINGEWQEVQYDVERLQLTPDYLGSPIYAFGLTTTNEDANPLLIYKGTTYPTDHGAFLSIMTDMNPFGSVGGYVYHFGKETINRFIDDAIAGDKKVKVQGQSLGGAMTLQTVLNRPEAIERADAYVPPAMLAGTCKSYNKRFDELGEANMPTVNVWRQENDPVSAVGQCWAKGWKVHSTHAKKENWLVSHMKAFTGQKRVMVLKVDPVRDMNSIPRKIFTFLHLALSIPLFVINAVIMTIWVIANKIFEAISALCKRNNHPVVEENV